MNATARFPEAIRDGDRLSTARVAAETRARAASCSGFPNPDTFTAIGCAPDVRDRST
jgi:hypothetical protein